MTEEEYDYPNDELPRSLGLVSSITKQGLLSSPSDYDRKTSYTYFIRNNASERPICTWHADLAELAKVLIEAMWQDALLAPYLCTDATGVLVQANEKCRRGHFWVVAVPERHVLFGYSAKHDSAAIDRLLRGYTGYLVADAHSVFDHLYRRRSSAFSPTADCHCTTTGLRELRREALGRKNWLFVGSDEAAEVNATFVSLLASCRYPRIARRTSPPEVAAR